MQVFRCPVKIGVVAFSLSLPSLAATPAFRKDIQPILQQYCYDCHGDGAKKGGVAFDEIKSDDAAIADHELWYKALRNLRAGLMPPPKKDQPNAEQKERIESWIKTAVFQVDPGNLDPGRVTVRRLNRVEYRNTIRDLMGIDFDTDKEFPPDDSGRGFDNISDALTLSPMLLEKYLTAANTIVTRAVPKVSGVPAEHVVTGKSFSGAPSSSGTNRIGFTANSIGLLYYDHAIISNRFKAEHAGKYQVSLDVTAAERFLDNQFDYNKCQISFQIDGHEVQKAEFTREGNRAFHYEADQSWAAGDHQFQIELTPLTPDQKPIRSLTMRVESVTVKGPLEKEHWTKPKNYERFFGQDPPAKPAELNRYTRSILSDFVAKAYRRPVEKQTVDRLVALAERVYSQKDKTVEDGIGQAMLAVLASPRFLFREEAVIPSKGTYPQVDEYALASRLSYFLWSSMPDDELIRLAAKGELRKNLAAQQKRMLADWKFDAFIRNFVGQWLQTRDIDSISIDARQVLFREAAPPAPDPEMDKKRQRARELRDKDPEKLTPEEKAERDALRQIVGRSFGFNRQPRAELTGDLRRAMRQETERTVDYVIKQDRSLVELLDSDYTFLNERLATHYGLTNLNVTGEEMRLVKLPADSARGGVLTQGSVLAVTSNPTRTSPVKRGLFVLDNLLGTPPPPPPPDIPPLEDAAKGMKGKSLRETLALHREQPLCSSCHNRMDPLGLALDNFNALGMWRDKEFNQPIDATGKLLSGESFADVRELKHILADKHADEFYRTITEKMLTYALGRGLEYYDVATVDEIVGALKKSNGRPSALMSGIINSAPFQKTRASETLSTTQPTRTEARNNP